MSVIIPDAQLLVVDWCMAQRTVLELDLFDLVLDHFMPAGLASVVLFAEDGSAGEHAGLEVRAANFAAGIVLSDLTLACLPWTGELIGLRLFGRVPCEDADSNFLESLLFLGCPHPFQLDKGP